jgi:hypothetical protein
VVASSQAVRIGPLDSIGASKGERDVLMMCDLIIYRLPLPIQKAQPDGVSACEIRIAHRLSAAFLLRRTWFTWGG